MEAELRSRKRKQRSSKSDPFAGIFTRGKSQIYVHRHRSGFARADSIRNRNLKQPLGTAKSAVKRERSEARVDQVTTQVSVKDLRARRVFSPTSIAGEVVSTGEVDKTSDGNPNVPSSEDDGVHRDLGVSDRVGNDMKPKSENILDLSSVRENNAMEADEFVQITPIVAKSDENKQVAEENGTILVANEIVDTKASISKSQSLVTSLRGRRKVFKSPSSFGYRRLLPYLTDASKDDLSKFEIVEVTLPGKDQKSRNMPPNTVACKDEEIGAVSDVIKLADDVISNNSKIWEKPNLNSVNPNLIRTIESAGLLNVAQKNHDDVLGDILEECEQMTPPDADIYRKSEVNKSSVVVVKPTDSSSASKLVLKPSSRMKALQTPTSFSHRRLLPFLMSVAREDSSASKVNQSLKPENDTEQNPEPQALSLLHQVINMDESITNGNSGPEKSDSPTSTLIPADASFDRMKANILVSNDNTSDANGSDMACNGSISQLEMKLQAETVKSDISGKLEQESPKDDLKHVEESNSKAISLCCTTKLETLPSICPVNVSIHQSSTQIVPLNSPLIHGENLRNGILKRTPRGCRGTCNCLNCTSFRLHAERSFEFSRNQMHDAEEIALELMKDLTCLRNILEKTASDANHTATVQEKQVKEVCEKALHTEEVARMRLAQMNEDLSIHCRSTNLLRPKVSFANKIEEKVISKAGWPQ